MAGSIEKILFVHNRYVYSGGEDSCADAEKELLHSYGHEVIDCEWDNADIQRWGAAHKLVMMGRPSWSIEAARRVRDAIAKHAPQVMHVQNFFPLASPSVFYAASKAGTPTVYTLHNYRPLCANGLFLRDGKVCTECVEHSPRRGVRYGCYRSSRMQTVPVAAMQYLHHGLSTWDKKVDLYIAPTIFVKELFVGAGFPADRIVVKPHFLSPDPGFEPEPGPHAAFVGHLSEKKGLVPLLDAWEHIDLPLKIIGDGPLEEEVRARVDQAPLKGRVELLGRLTVDRLIPHVKSARFLVVPSLHHEGFGRVVLEAFAGGTPVIASNLEPLNQIVEHGRTGFTFATGDAGELRRAVQTARAHTGQKEMRRAARKEFEEKYSAAGNYEQLMSAYARAIQNRAHAEPHKDSVV